MKSHAMKSLGIGVFSLAITAISQVGVAAGAGIPTVSILNPIKESVRTPVKAALDADGNVFVTDPANRGILRYNRFGAFQQVLQTPSTPQGIYCLPDGKLLVGQGTYVAILNSDGTEAGKLGSGIGQFSLANGIAVDAAGFIYVVDTNENAVKVFTSAGQFSFQFGTKGIDNGQFTLPTAIAYEKNSNQIAVVDTVNGRIQFFDTLGNWVRTLGSLGSGAMRFTYPQGIAFDYGRDGSSSPRMYIVDTFQSSVQVLDPAGAGTFLSFVGGYGTGNGQLVVPSDVIFDAANSRLIVVNGYGYLTIYGIDGGTSPVGDTTPPALSLDPVPAVTSQASLTITGSVENGATFAVSLNGVNAPVTVNGTSWSATLTLAGGANSIKAVATDAAGNPATQSAVVTYLLAAPGLTVNAVPPVTNQSTITLSGTTDDGSTVTVALNGQPAQEATVSGAGWTATVSLVAGVNSLLIKAEKPLSATVSTTVTTVVDQVAPGLNLDPVPGNVLDAQLNITGTTEAAAAVTVAVNGGTPQSVTVAGTGAFSAPVTLVAGPNTVRIVTVDLAGNSTAHNAAITYLLAAPAFTVNPLAGATNSATHTLSGTTDAGATITVSLNGGAPQAATVSGTTWSRTLSGFISGANTITIAASRLYGATATKTMSVRLDSDAPALTLSILSDGSYTSVPTLNISGLAIDTDAVTITVNGAAVPALNGSFSTAVTLLQGANIITVTATDAAGNLTSDTRTIYYDNSKPVVDITSPSDGTFTKTATVAITGTIDTQAIVTVAGIPALMDGTKWTATVNLEPGLNTIEVQATDLAGNSSNAKRTVILDAMAPALKIITPREDFVTRQSVLPLSLSVSDASGISVTALVNGVEKTVTGADGLYTFNADFATEGAYFVTVNAYDRAGNTATAVRTVIYDATPPALSIDPVTAVYPQLLGGTLEPGATITASDRNGTVGMFTVVGSRWEADLGTVYDPATLLITATDAAGNVVSKAFSVHEPDGDLNGDGVVTNADALMALKLVVENIKPTNEQILHGDVGPLLDGKPNPDGKIDLTDVIILFRKALAAQ